MKKNKTKDLLFIPAQSSKAFVLKEQFVCYKKDTNLLKSQLSPEDFKTFLSFYEVEKKGLKKATATLVQLKNLYSSCSEIYNLLSYLYIRQRKVKKADAIILENYQKNPENLLAKINYADQLLRRKKYSMIGEVFQNKTDLRDLYPDKKIFYLTEFRGFMVLMGHYHLSLGKKHEAECYHYLATRVDKKNSQVNYLRNKILQKPFHKKLYEKFFKKSKSYN